ncbi:flagellar basal body P-ring protein FlgI [Sulfurospirillum sp. 1612]|uniref:flagellar basal body P-ring protein FlgI n=1 Tax=Sulfurospirillum sp. 1612 TaxID=3094835 RepID=UPI002F9507C8
MKRFILLCLILSNLSFLQAEKIKNIANIIGVRENQLIGYGLVVGLNGTGDGTSSKFTLRSLANLLQTVNVKISSSDIKSKNVAAVIVTTKLGAFARQGDKMDVVISSIGDAKSLQGGTLLLTALKGVDGKIYALAQGSITIGGMNPKRSKGQVNHATNGTIFNGAIVERDVAYDLYDKKFADLSLKHSDFNTAITIEKTLNTYFEQNVATAIDPRTIRLKKPDNLSMVAFLAKMENVNVKYEKEEKIVIDERTGTVVSGIGIHVSPIIITHGDITIKIEPRKVMPKGKEQVNLGDGVKIAVNQNELNMKEKDITIANITRALHKLGATPKDIISIIENIKRAGAINAKLEII